MFSTRPPARSPPSSSNWSRPSAEATRSQTTSATTARSPPPRATASTGTAAPPRGRGSSTTAHGSSSSARAPPASARSGSPTTTVTWRGRSSSCRRATVLLRQHPPGTLERCQREERLLQPSQEAGPGDPRVDPEEQPEEPADHQRGDLNSHRWITPPTHPTRVFLAAGLVDHLGMALDTQYTQPGADVEHRINTWYSSRTTATR